MNPRTINSRSVQRMADSIMRFPRDAAHAALLEGLASRPLVSTAAEVKAAHRLAREESAQGGIDIALGYTIDDNTGDKRISYCPALSMGACFVLEPLVIYHPDGSATTTVWRSKENVEHQHHEASEPTARIFTDAETATILAALRYWQKHVTDNSHVLPMSVPMEVADHFQDNEPLDADAIDELSERINSGEL